MTVHDGPTVTLDGPACVALDAVLGRELDKARGRLDRSSRAYRALIELRTVAALHAADQASLRLPARSDDDCPQMPASLGVAVIAGRVGVTRQAIRHAASIGRLIGTKDDRGRWQFTSGAVQDWQERRRR